MQLRELIENASRETLVEFLLSVIHGFTIMARDCDRDQDAKDTINNRIHYLAGHALSLARGEELESWQLDDIVEQSNSLAPSLRKHPTAILKKLDPGSRPG